MNIVGIIRMAVSRWRGCLGCVESPGRGETPARDPRDPDCAPGRGAVSEAINGAVTVRPEQAADFRTD